MIDPKSTSADLPELTDPMVVVAFEGWNDAGDAATMAVEHLEQVWSATPVLALDPEEYYDFQVNRPTVSVADDGRRHITWPTTRVSYARLPDLGHDLVLVRGIEPSMRWRTFTAEILALCHQLSVRTVLTLGALLADTPHTRPVPVTATSSDRELAERLGLDQSRYEGPTGIVGVLHEACADAGLPALSIWSAVPHYVSQTPCPKATLALLRRVEDLLQLQLPLGDLPAQARAWEVGVDQLAAEDAEVADYVRTLEQAKDAADLPEASGEAIAQEFERYLRRRDEGHRRDEGR